MTALFPGAEVRALSGGYSGETFLVTAGGDQAVLRLYARAPERAAVDRALLDRVRGLLPVPRVLEASLLDDGPERPPFLLLEALPGDRLDVVLPAADPPLRRRLGGAVAGMLVLLATERMPRHGWFPDARLEPEPFPAAAADPAAWVDAHLGSPWLAGLPGAEREALRAVARRATALSRRGGRPCLVHADFNPKNLLVDPATGGVTGVLDWEYAYAGASLADVGNLLRVETDGEFAAAVADGYAGRAPDVPDDWVDVARALDLLALVDLAGRTAGNPVVDGARRLPRATARSATSPRAGPTPPVTVTVHVAEVVLPVAAPPVAGGAVAVDGDRVVWVGPAADWSGGGEVVRWPGLLTPGLVNAHAHLQYTAYADLCRPGVDFLDWISVFARRNATMTAADWQASTAAGVGELLRTGTTAVADVAADPVVVRAAEGLAGVSYLEAVGADGAGWPARRPAFLDRLAAGTDRAVGVSPHTLYTLGSGVVRDCVALARDRGLRLHPHLAESPYEVEFVATGTGPFAAANRRWGLDLELAAGGSARTPAAELAGLGALGPDVHVAHGVHCDAADRALLRAHRTAVALCPRSNTVLGVGEAPVAAYRAEGSPVAVGTDSRASVRSLDLLADVAALRDIALGQGSPPAGLDRWLVEAATRGGAAALGLGDVGVLRPGARADLAAFAVEPGPDPYAALVGAAGRCVGTVLAGRVVHDLAH